MRRNDILGEKTALYCLAQHDWKLDIALDNYFANPEVSLLIEVCTLHYLFVSYTTENQEQ